MLKFDRTVDRVVRVYGPDGQFRLNLPIYLQGAAVSWAYEVAVDSDGSFVVGAGGGTGNMREVPQRLGLMVFDANGAQTGVIDTGRYTPGHIPIAAER